MARALALMSVVGGLLSGVSLLADLTPDRHRAVALVLSAVSVGFAAGVFALRRRMTPRWFATVFVPGATLQLSLGVALSGDPYNAGAVLYVAIASFSAYFLPHRVAAAQIAFAALAYAVVLAPLAPPAVALDRWMFTFGVAVTAAVVLAGLRDRLVALTRTDPLTGLANRLAFAERLEVELARAAREARTAAVVVVDLDRFKAVNDRGGHGAGDAALRAVAALLAGALRRHDVAARVGGDEFAVLLTGGDGSAARAFAARVLGTAAGDPALPGLSLGAAVFPTDAPDGPGLVRAADAALYAAKHAGRGRLAVARAA
jgi:diguanylate cyclase (GGDEF)-like protein